MSLEVVPVCHLGSKCEEIVDGKIHRCRQYIKIQGTDAQGIVHDDWGCSFAWVPILMLDQSRHNIHNTAAIDKMCTTMTSRRESLLSLVSDSMPALENRQED